VSNNQEKFQEILIETVGKILPEVLGEKIARALRFYVDLRSALKTPDRFFRLMGDLVGQRQAINLREKTLRVLHQRYGAVYQPTEGNFSDAIASLRSKLDKNVSLQ